MDKPSSGCQLENFAVPIKFEELLVLGLSLDLTIIFIIKNVNFNV